MLAMHVTCTGFHIYMGNYLFIVVFNIAGGMHEYAVINASCVHLAQWQSVLSITAGEGILLM